MSILYCPECGAKLEYAVQKPKFCSSCGASLGFSAKGASTSKEAASQEQEESVPRLSKLEYEVSLDTALPTIGSVIREQLNEDGGTLAEGPIRPAAPEKEKNKTGDELLKESVARCQSARKPEEISEQ